MKIIPLTKGYSAMVDDEDYEYLIKKKWYAHASGRNFYAQTNIYNDGGKSRTVIMHRFILKVTDSKIIIDHIDGDSLNNQKSNLRIATHSQNGANRKPAKNKKYLGVHFFIRKVRGHEYEGYNAVCRKDGKYYRKLCKTEIEAALEYNKMALALHGDFARLNIIEQP